MTEDLNTPMLHMRLPSRGSKILRRVTMKTEQEQIKAIKQIIDERVETTLGQVQGRHDNVIKTVDTVIIARDIVNAGYGDVSEYKAEIERLRTTLGQCNTELNSALESLKSQCREIGELKAGVKQAQIDVLNQLKEKYGFYICCTWTHATKLLGEIIDEFIDKIKNEQDTSNDTARG